MVITKEQNSQFMIEPNKKENLKKNYRKKSSFSHLINNGHRQTQTYYHNNSNNQTILGK